MRTVVFLGPTLPLDAARRILPAEYRPPVRLGDVSDLVIDRNPPEVIAIVDGLFEQVPTVWHKEILYALSRGVRVYGAASMGAIRAAELHPFGMTGVGMIFEKFLSGDYEDDDEVAVSHAGSEDGFRPLSDAMVNIRQGVEQAVAANVLDPARGRHLVDSAKTLFYPERCWQAVYDAGTTIGICAGEIAALREFIEQTRPDAKRDDVVELLALIARLPAKITEPARASFTFERTYNWEKLVTIVRGQRERERLGEVLTSGDDETSERGDAYEAFIEKRPDIAQAALFDLLIQREAERLGLPETRSGTQGSSVTRSRIRDRLIRHYRTDLPRHLLDHLGSARIGDIEYSAKPVSTSDESSTESTP